MEGPLEMFQLVLQSMTIQLTIIIYLQIVQLPNNQTQATLEHSVI